MLKAVEYRIRMINRDRQDKTLDYRDYEQPPEKDSIIDITRNEKTRPFTVIDVDSKVNVITVEPIS